MAFQPFGKDLGPRDSAKPQATSEYVPPSPTSEYVPPSPTCHMPSFTSPPSSRFVEYPPELGDGNKLYQNQNVSQDHQRLSFVLPFAGAQGSEIITSARSTATQDLKRSRSPSSLPIDDKSLRISRDVRGRSDLSPPTWDNQANLFDNFASLPTIHRELTSGTLYNGTADTWNSSRTNLANYENPRETQFLPVSTNNISQENSRFGHTNSRRPSVSPPRFGGMSSFSSFTPDLQSHPQSLPVRETDSEVVAGKANFSVPKRTRSPNLPSATQMFENYSDQYDDAERELQAKAKRLVRFKNELSQPVSHTVGNEKVIEKKIGQSATDERNLGGEASVDPVVLFSGGISSQHHEDIESSAIIIGMCPDMCPESERTERERKGDLDHYERLDGDRNQTTKFLAVKKYNRTAEREAELIRPMPILKNTIDYLVNLLDRPYDDGFLGLYNFLWDRMRAIRMDLRMQHIFDLDAIIMLEKMIRFHIIAIHELCEYTRGEGFSEGFDAHLNIEQMNKTSVELFQLYDDHRKQQIDVPTEKEFRGYYALLKLDRHPGYKVEPSELSLDLSKMTTEIRQTPEVLFARDVARACRTGNFIAFFRLARKASYLQACLMHAHFAKLRTQALASIHSSLQNNQGIPVSLLAQWLGMEEEDIGDLLEYHGFWIKEFEEPYMVKDGPFLNIEDDFPVRCSKLVHLKKSGKIIDDVLACHTSLSCEEVKHIHSDELGEHESAPAQFSIAGSSAQVSSEKILDQERVLLPKEKQLRSMFKPLPIEEQNADDQVTATSSLQRNSSFQVSVGIQQGKLGIPETPNYDSTLSKSLERPDYSNTNATLMGIPSRIMEPDLLPASQLDYTENALSQPVIMNETEDVTDMDFREETNTDSLMVYYDKVVAEAKLKLILRLWKRYSSKKKELREQRQLAARAALSSLPLGPPIWEYKARPLTCGELNIDHVMSTRYQKRELSRAKLNVSEVVATNLSERNPGARCLCWKLVLCFQGSPHSDDVLGWASNYLASSTWLSSKLMPAGDDSDDDLVISSSSLSIWKKWIPGYSEGHWTCCFSVIKTAELDKQRETVEGASGFLFLVSDCVSWELQKACLHNLLADLPSGSRLPLLILATTYRDNSYPSTIIAELGLHDVDKSRISTFSVVSLVKNLQNENMDGLFSEEGLREGLRWLASECPLQPNLQCLRTRDLILSHLLASIEFVDDTSACRVGPDYCISAFNDALDQSIRDITAAATLNSFHWPCPEIELLELRVEEGAGYLPKVGWSSAGKVGSLLSTLRDCKLPSFLDVTWLYSGCDTVDDIKNHRAKLEECLITYLTQSSQLMGPLMAVKEASTIVQTCTFFRLHGSTYYLIPNWPMIFKRIFNWRLMSILHGDVSTTYVLAQNVAAISASKSPSKFVSESNHCLVRPYLDEMVEVGCSSPGFGMQQPGDKTFLPACPSPLNEGITKVNLAKDPLKADARELEQDMNSAKTSINSSTYLSNTCSSCLVVANKATNEADRLNMLLQQCNIVQNMIDEKLSFYF